MPPLKPVAGAKASWPPGRRSGGKAHWSGDGVAVGLHCPRGNGAAGCRGTLTVQFRAGRGTPLLDGGSTPFELASGERRELSVATAEALRDSLATRHRVKLRITAATRAEDGGIRLTHARRFVSG